MSSVSSKGSSTSGSTGQEEVNRKAREDYRKNEAELIKKHNRAIRALNEKHVKELDEVNKKYGVTLDQARDRSRTALTERDKKYQKEIEEIRQVHTNQLEKLMKDNQLRLETQRRASKLETDQAKLGKDDRVKELHNRYDQQLVQEQEKYREQLDDVRQRQKEMITQRSEDLRESHQKEVDSLRDERNETVTDLRNQYRSLQRNASADKRRQEVKHMGDRMRTSSAHMDALKNLDETHGEIQDTSRQGFQEGLKNVRDRFADARQKDLENQQGIREQFNASVEDRVDGQINRLKRDLAAAKEKSVRADDKARLKSQNEVNSIRDTYQQKFEYMDKARQDTLSQQNEINAKDIRKVREEVSQQMVDSAKYYRGRMETENFRNRAALDSLEKDYEMRVDYNKNNAEERVDRIRDDHFTQEAKLRENFKTNVDLMKETTHDEKRELVMTQQKERIQAESVLKQQIQKQEVDHQRRMSDVVNKYEKRLSDLNDQFVREKRLRETREKQLLRDVQRKHASEIETVKVQYERKNQETQAAHEKEIRDVNRRQQEKLDEVLTTVKKNQT